MAPMGRFSSGTKDIDLGFSNNVNAYMTYGSRSKDSKKIASRAKAKLPGMKATSQTQRECSRKETDNEQENARHRDVTSQTRTEQYYVFVTDAYLRGWSTHFSFAPFTMNQSILEAQVFSEHKLAMLMGLKPGMKVLDVGCGIGAPAREIAQFVGCEIVGVSINQGHVDRAAYMTARDGLSALCTFVKADFMDLPFATSSFDAAYAIEATCHAPSLHGVYAEIARVLKPDAPFGLSEWVLTPTYNPLNAKHVQIRKTIEHGGGISTLNTADNARGALSDVGFRVLHEEDYSRHWDTKLEFDQAGESTAPGSSSVLVPYKRGHDPPRPSESEREREREQKHEPKYKPTHSCDLNTPHLCPAPPPVHPQNVYFLPKSPLSHLSGREKKMSAIRPWYFPLRGHTHLTTTRGDHHTVFKMSSLPRKTSYWVLRVFEVIGLWPKGTTEAMDVLRECVNGCADGGEQGIFSPSWWFICRNDKVAPRMGKGRDEENIERAADTDTVA